MTHEELRQAYVRAARKDLDTDYIQVDMSANISVTDEANLDDDGAWVQAWIWIDREDVPELAGVPDSPTPLKG